MSDTKKKALFVCLGNICRSPIAEAVFQKTVDDLNTGDQWEIDSAAIGDWHIGRRPDKRALDTMRNHNLPYNNTARQIKRQDFYHYDYIFGMDESNIRDLTDEQPEGSKARILLLGLYHPEGKTIIRDPYYDNDAKGFEKCYEQCVLCTKRFLEELENGRV